MPATTGHTWACPSCGRRVPLRAEQCHCGMTRARAQELEAAQPAAARVARPRRGASDRQEALAAMTGDVKLLLAVTGLVLVAGLGWLTFGPRPKPVAPVLGFVDAGPPKIVQKAERAKPPFKLPWWK